MNKLKEFLRIPGVGKSIAQDFIDLGYSKVDELKSIGLDKPTEAKLLGDNAIDWLGVDKTIFI